MTQKDLDELIAREHALYESTKKLRKAIAVGVGIVFAIAAALIVIGVLTALRLI